MMTKMKTRSCYMSLKEDAIILGIAGVAAYFIITKVFPDVLGNAAKGIKGITDTVYKSGADTGNWLRMNIIEGNFFNLQSSVKAMPSQETIDLEKQAGFYYEPITKGFLPVGYTWKNPNDPFHSSLIKVGA
jgi:hypothetical protein